MKKSLPKKEPKTTPKTIVYLSLGSNIKANRLSYLNYATERMSYHPKIDLLDKSMVYETEPWIEGKHPHAKLGNGWFLNQSVKIQTTLKPVELLKVLEGIERSLGRSNKGMLNIRTIDIDILLYGEEIVDLPELQIPHKHMKERQFVLIPLVEIAPNLQDPITKKKYRHMLDKLSDDNKVMLFY